MTFALLLMGVSSAYAGEEKTIYTYDYSVQGTKVPGAWGQNPNGTDEVIDGAYVITNTEATSNNYELQVFIANGFDTQAGYTYKINIWLKADGDGKGDLATAAWGGTNMEGSIEFTASDDFTEYSFTYGTPEDEDQTGAHVLWQSGHFVGTVQIQKVEIIEIAPDEPIVEPEWTNIIVNSDLTGDDMSCFICKEYPSTEVVPATTETVDDVKAIAVKSAALVDNPWDTQFWIRMPQIVPAGTKFKLSFDYMASENATVGTQTHNEPSQYVHYAAIGDVEFTTSWKTFEKKVTVPSQCDKNKHSDTDDWLNEFHSIAFNLSVAEKDITYYFKNVKFELAPEDVVTDELAPIKDELKTAIDLGNAQNGFGKTAESFGVLTTAISDAEAALIDDGATKESLQEAKKAIDDAIAGLACADGYTKLTADMFKKWDDNVAPTTAENSGCDYNVNVSTGQPYGASTVNYLTFADISEFNEMILFATEGTPRIMMNREVPLPIADTDPVEYEYGDANGSYYVELKGESVDEKYEVIDNKYTVKLTAYPYAHVNAIKGANWASVTVTDMLLYRFISFGEAGWASFGSNYKSAKIDATVYAVKFNSETGKMDLTKVEDGIVPAGAGVIIEGTSEVLPQFDVEAADAVESDLLISNGTVKGDGESIYVLAKKGDVVGFYLLTKDEVIPAGKAYYKAPAGDGARAFIALGGDVTGIKTVESVKAANNAIYNLAGQRLVKAQKGLNIVNGKKIMK